MADINDTEAAEQQWKKSFIKKSKEKRSLRRNRSKEEIQEQRDFAENIHMHFIDAYASNNWAVHGNHTVTGKPLMA